eukprot:4811080-Pleurochrysis_carterae.AAC.5
MHKPAGCRLHYEPNGKAPEPFELARALRFALRYAAARRSVHAGGVLATTDLAYCRYEKVS